MTVYASRPPTTRKIPAQMASTNKETSRLAWAGVERGLKMLVTLVGTSAANAGLTRKVVAIKRKEAFPSAQRAFKIRNPNFEIRNLILLKKSINATTKDSMNGK